jgi:hypothetical protein
MLLLAMVEYCETTSLSIEDERVKTIKKIANFIEGSFLGKNEKTLFQHTVVFESGGSVRTDDDSTDVFAEAQAALKSGPFGELFASTTSSGSGPSGRTLLFRRSTNW